MEIILYSTGCPKCTVLKRKLDEKNVPYQVEDDVDKMLANGIINVPVLQVDGNQLDFGAAIAWINEKG